MTILSLKEWMTSNCNYLERAVQDVPANGDLQPFFAAMKDDTPMIFGVDLLQFDKAFVVDLFKAFLHTVGADQYAIIAAAWYVKLPRVEAERAVPVLDREGTGGAYKDQRRECYQITVGDRERSLIALYDVERDWKGKIRRLIRRTGVGGMPEGLFGRMVNLLVERTVH